MKGGQVRETVRKLNREEIDRVVRWVSQLANEHVHGPLSQLSCPAASGSGWPSPAPWRPAPKEVLFMDEPLSNLDAKLRLEMRSGFSSCTPAGNTFIYVTHDQMEAMTWRPRSACWITASCSSMTSP